MEPGNTQPSIDPYAPPKAIPNDANTTTYLKEDGYAFQNELVANHHFKSPLICAKLGIAIRSETTPQPKNITIKRISSIPKTITNVISVISTLIIILCFFYMSSENIMPALVIYTIASSIFHRLTSKPYQIPFYFSEQYNHIHKRRIITLSIVAIIIASTFTIGIITNNSELYAFALLAAVSTLVFYKLRTTKFIVTQTKGEFYYIRGIHKGLLDALPHLPLSS